MVRKLTPLTPEEPSIPVKDTSDPSGVLRHVRAPYRVQPYRDLRRGGTVVTRRLLRNQPGDWDQYDNDDEEESGTASWVKAGFRVAIQAAQHQSSLIDGNSSNIQQLTNAVAGFMSTAATRMMNMEERLQQLESQHPQQPVNTGSLPNPDTMSQREKETLGIMLNSLDSLDIDFTGAGDLQLSPTAMETELVPVLPPQVPTDFNCTSLLPVQPPSVINNCTALVPVIPPNVNSSRMSVTSPLEESEDYDDCTSLVPYEVPIDPVRRVIPVLNPGHRRTPARLRLESGNPWDSALATNRMFLRGEDLTVDAKTRLNATLVLRFIDLYMQVQAGQVRDSHFQREPLPVFKQRMQGCIAVFMPSEDVCGSSASKGRPSADGRLRGRLRITMNQPHVRINPLMVAEMMQSILGSRMSISCVKNVLTQLEYFDNKTQKSCWSKVHPSSDMRGKSVFPLVDKKHATDTIVVPVEVYRAAVDQAKELMPVLPTCAVMQNSWDYCGNKSKCIGDRGLKQTKLEPISVDFYQAMLYGPDHPPPPSTYEL